MTEAQTIREQVDAYLKTAGVTGAITKLGDSCPPFCEDKGKQGVGQFPRRNHIHGQHYQLALTRDRKTFVTDFWNNYHDAELNAGWVKRNGSYYDVPAWKKSGRPGAPKAADILRCMTWADPGSFENFCSEFGYESDSRKAYRTYELICEEHQNLCQFFTASERNELEEMGREL